MVRGDICGDDRTEVVDYVMGQAAHVYASAPCDLSAKVTGRPLPQSKKLYNYTRYTAEEVPRNLAEDRRWRPARLFGPPAWRVDLGRLRELTGVRLDLDTRRAAAYRVETSVDGRRWTRVAAGTTDTTGAGRVELTGLGRYVRITVTRCGGPVRLAAAAVDGTR